MFLTSHALSLLACDEPTSIPNPDSARRTLDAGSWEVQVLAVDASRCREVRGEDLVGASLYGDLSVRGSSLVFNLEGARLVGEISRDSLYVEGALPVSDQPARPPREDESEPDDVDYDDSDSSDTDAGDPGARGSSDAPDDGDVSSEPRGGGHHGGHLPPRAHDAWASIEADILSRRLANGLLSISMDRCELELKVVMAYVGGDDRGVVVVSEEDEDVSDAPDDAPPSSGDADAG